MNRYIRMTSTNTWRKLNSFLTTHLSTMETRVGEEFRDDVRKKLPAEILAPLTQLDTWRSTGAVIYTIGLLTLTIGVAVSFWSWWVAPIAIVLIAPLQHALFILAHEAAHYRLHANRVVNDILGRLIGPRYVFFWIRCRLFLPNGNHGRRPLNSSLIRWLLVRRLAPTHPDSARRRLHTFHRIQKMARR